MENIKIYGIESCSYCNEIKTMLTKNNINFDYVDVNLVENEVEYNQLHKLTKSDDVPIIKINKKILVPNISFKSINECYTIITYLINEK